MAERFWRQSAIAHLNIAARARPDAAAAVRLTLRRPRRLLNLRGAAEGRLLDAIEATLGFVLPLNSPETAGEGAYSALWLGPDEWLIVAEEGAADPAPRLGEALGTAHVALTDVSEAYAIFALTGDKARAVLQKGSGLDLHRRSFRPGQVAQTLLARADVTLHQTGDAAYEIYVRRSFAEYLWLWLEDAGREFDLAVALD